MKKINSEITILSDEIKLKVGTVNKKNPTSIYAVFGTYITPLKEKQSYELELNKIFKSTERYANVLAYQFCQRGQTIFISDVADTRMEVGKKTYLELQFYVKPTIETLISNNKNFKSIATNISDICFMPTLNYVKMRLESAGYQCSNSKY